MTRIAHGPAPRGFTLVELLITVALVAILAVVAAPSFTTYAANQRVKAASFELMSALNLARSEALKRNRNATLAAQTGGWINGWLVQVGGTTLRSWAAPTKLAIADGGETSVVFRPDGRASTALKLTVCDEAGSAEVWQRIVTLDPSGRPNIKRRDETCDGS